MFDLPKLTTNANATGVQYRLDESKTSTEVLSDNGSMFSAMFSLKKGAIITDFKFRVKVEKIQDFTQNE